MLSARIIDKDGKTLAETKLIRYTTTAEQEAETAELSRRYINLVKASLDKVRSELREIEHLPNN